tara:strand:+ start:852 stop:1433 length:582 start_codon:yes stop_codon:yes gene_type:complete
MKNKYLLTVVSIMIFSCASSNNELVSTTLVDGAVDNATNCLREAPEWVMAPGRNAVVGSGESTDFTMSKQLAVANAIEQIGQKINTAVDASLNQKAANSNDNFVRVTKTELNLKVDELVNSFEATTFFLCPKVINGSQGYQQFAFVEFNVADFKDGILAETKRLREENKEDEFTNLLNSFDSDLDSVLEEATS